MITAEEIARELASNTWHLRHGTGVEYELAISVNKDLWETAKELGLIMVVRRLLQGRK
jgi:hypothetical protein